MSELQLVQVRKAAELTTAAEAVRARVLAGDATADLDALVKLEGEAKRAVRALNINTHARPQVPDLQAYLVAKAAERSSLPDGEANEADDGEAEA